MAVERPGLFDLNLEENCQCSSLSLSPLEGAITTKKCVESPVLVIMKENIDPDSDVEQGYMVSVRKCKPIVCDVMDNDCSEARTPGRSAAEALCCLETKTQIEESGQACLERKKPKSVLGQAFTTIVDTNTTGCLETIKTVCSETIKCDGSLKYNMRSANKATRTRYAKGDILSWGHRAQHSATPNPVFAEGDVSVQKETPTSSKVKIPRKDNQKLKPRDCPVCGRWFSDKNGLWRHKQIHLVDKAYKCQYCPMTFPRGERLLSHTFTHTGVYPFHCDICGLGLLSYWGKTCHMRLHAGEKPHACVVCEKKFTTKSDLTKHMAFHLKIKRFRYRCGSCGKHFSRKKDLISHQYVHSDARNFGCNLCNKTFKRKFGLDKHVEIVHSKKDETYYCPHCPKSFDMKHKIRNHVNRHEMEKKIECQICKRMFLFRSDLKKHQLSSHTSIKPFMCTHCGKHFKRQAWMNNHVRAVHFAVKSSCHICGQEFHRKGDLDNHLQVHNNGLPFSCDVCGKEYLRRKCFNTHMLLHA